MKVLLQLLFVILIFSCTNNEGSNEQKITKTGCGYAESNLLEDPSELCNFVSNRRGFVSNIDAEKALDRILGVTGLSPTFIMQECNGINNCYATSLSGVRYILFDPEFMKEISDETNKWSNLSILAHEIGHHVNGHSLDLALASNDEINARTIEEHKRDELEADYYSGFIMYKLGATLEASQQVMKLMPDVDEKTSTYPTKAERLDAIEEGYNKAKSQDPNIQNSNNDANSMSLEDYKYEAVDCYERGEYELAVEYTSKAITLDPNWSIGYFNRGIYFAHLEKYSKSISDLSKYIELNPNDLDGYIERGVVYDDLAQYENAISDYSYVIERSPISEPLSYLARGMSYSDLEQYSESITDFSTFIGFCPDSSDGYYYRGDAYSYLEMYNESISDFSKYIELNPDDPLGYWMRAYTKKDANIAYCKDFLIACRLDDSLACEDFLEYECGDDDGPTFGLSSTGSEKWTSDDYFEIADYFYEKEDYKAAIEIYTECIETNPENYDAYNSRAAAFFELEKYEDAIADYTLSIRIDTNISLSYKNRGISKEYAELPYCSDYKKACELGDEESCEWYNDQCQ